MVKVSKEQVNKLKEKWSHPLIVDEDDDEARKEEVMTKSPMSTTTPRHLLAVSNFAAITPPETKEDFKENDNGAATAHQSVQFIRNLKMKKVTPCKELTGVEESITEICASISNQVYSAKSENDFRLEARGGRTAEVVIYDDHGEFLQTSPTFVVATTEDTLIMGWQGSTYLLDWIDDFAFNPVNSPELGEAATGIKGSGSFFSHIASDLLIHQDKIKECIENKKRKRSGQENTRIKKIVFTGHSLGGGLANVAHLFVQAKINDETSFWSGKDLSLNTVTFAAVMSFLDLDEVEYENKKANKLMKQVEESSCNIIYGPDVVPRVYAHIDYLHDVLKAGANEMVDAKISKLMFGLRGIVKQKLLSLVQEKIKPLVGVMAKYRHIGSLIYYPPSDTDGPLKLQDTGPFYGAEKTNNDETKFHFYSFDKYEIEKGKVIQRLKEAHSYFPHALSHYVPKKDE